MRHYDYLEPMRIQTIAFPLAAIVAAALFPTFGEASPSSQLARLLRAPMTRYLLEHTDEGASIARHLSRAKNPRFAEKLEERLLKVEERLHPGGSIEVTTHLEALAKQELRTFAGNEGDLVFFEEVLPVAYSRSVRQFLEAGSVATGPAAFADRAEALLQEISAGNLGRGLTDLSNNGSHFFLRDLEAAADRFASLANEAHWKGYLLEKDAHYALVADVADKMTEALGLLKYLSGKEAMIFPKNHLPHLKKAFETIRGARAQVYGKDNLRLTLRIEPFTSNRFKVFVD